MKKHRVALLSVAATVLGISFVSSDSHASRARLSVMGDSDPFGVAPHGSLYYDDNYNHLYNPSFANDFKNWAAIEKSNDATGFYGNLWGNDSDQSGTEGGFVASIMNLSVGLFFNRDEGIGVGYAAAPRVIRPIDFTIAGDFGVKWGLGYTFAGGNRATNGDSSKENIICIGFQVADFEPFGAIRIASDQKITTGGDRDTTTHSGFTIGTRYRFGEWVPFAAYTQAKAGDLRDNAWGFGLGRNARVAEGVTLNYAIAYWRGQDRDGGAGGTDNIALIPISMSVEGDVNNWLTARAGLGYDLYHRRDSVSQDGAATGRLGATFHISKVNFDWAIGHTPSGQSLDANGFSIADGFFTDASLTYRW